MHKLNTIDIGEFKRVKIVLFNPIRLKWVPIWHTVPFSLYLRHGFRSDSEDVKAN